VNTTGENKQIPLHEIFLKASHEEVYFNLQMKVRWRQRLSWENWCKGNEIYLDAFCGYITYPFVQFARGVWYFRQAYIFAKIFATVSGASVHISNGVAPRFYLLLVAGLNQEKGMRQYDTSKTSCLQIDRFVIPASIYSSIQARSICSWGNWASKVWTHMWSFPSHLLPSS